MQISKTEAETKTKRASKSKNKECTYEKSPNLNSDTNTPLTPKKKGRTKKIPQ